MGKINYLLAIIIASVFVFTGCKYDDDDLWDKVNDLDEKVSSNTSALQSLVSAMENIDYITDVTPIMDGDAEIGYTIYFAKQPSISIYHGEEGGGIFAENGIDYTTDPANVTFTLADGVTKITLPRSGAALNSLAFMPETYVNGVPAVEFNVLYLDMSGADYWDFPHIPRDLFIVESGAYLKFRLNPGSADLSMVNDWYYLNRTVTTKAAGEGADLLKVKSVNTNVDGIVSVNTQINYNGIQGEQNNGIYDVAVLEASFPNDITVTSGDFLVDAKVYNNLAALKKNSTFSYSNDYDYTLSSSPDHTVYLDMTAENSFNLNDYFDFCVDVDNNFDITELQPAKDVSAYNWVLESELNTGINKLFITTDTGNHVTVDPKTGIVTITDNDDALYSKAFFCVIARDNTGNAIICHYIVIEFDKLLP